jgi:hypothetical protein
MPAKAHLAFPAAGFLLVALRGASCSEKAGEEVPKGDPGVQCYDLVRWCHNVDDGDPGHIHECHTLGHEGPEEQCISRHDECVEICKAAYPAVDAGTGDGDAGDSGSDADAADHPPVPLSDASLGGLRKCIELGNVCHAPDPGSGPIHECHQVGHAGNPDACEAQYDACLALCTEATP